MIADDSDNIRQFLEDLLTSENHLIVAQAVNGEDAMEKFNETNPDVLLLDISMPKKSGLSVLKEIMSVNPNARIVMITANDDINLAAQCIQQGALAFLMKPFDSSQQVLASIKMALAE